MQHVTGTTKARPNARRGVTPLAVRRTQACA